MKNEKIKKTKEYLVFKTYLVIIHRQQVTMKHLDNQHELSSIQSMKSMNNVILVVLRVQKENRGR